MGLFLELLGNAGVIQPNELEKDYEKLLSKEEKIGIGFQVVRDTFIFTNKRLILIDVQGLTGKKVEYLSIPYNKITKFSIETAGSLDLDAELKIWVGSEESPIEKKFNNKVNIYDVQRILANCTLD